jgi:MFS family permease
LALGLVDNARGPMLSAIMQAYALNHTQASWFFFLASGAGLIHNAVFLKFLSHAQPLKMLFLYMAIMATGVLILGITPLFSSSYGIFLMGTVCMGVGFGGLGVAQNACVQEAPDKYRAQSTALLHATYGLASLSSPFLIVQIRSWGLAKESSNWSLSFVVCAIPALCLLPIVFRELSLRRSRQPEANASTSIESMESMAPMPRLSASQTRAAWSAGLLLSAMVVAEISISSRLVIFAEEMDWPQSTAGLWLTGFFVALTLARLSLAIGVWDQIALRFYGLSGCFSEGIGECFGGRQPSGQAEPSKEAYDPSRRLRLVLGCALPLLILGLVDFGWPTRWSMLALVLFGFPIAMAYPLAITWYAKAFGANRQSVLSLAVTLQSAAAMLMHLLLGWGADQYGLRQALLVISVGSLVLALALLEPLRRQLTPNPAIHSS